MAGIKSSILTDQPFVSQLTQVKTVTIDAAASDVGHTGKTHLLRAGLVLAHDSVSGAYIHYQPLATAGQGSVASCILLQDCDLKNNDPLAADSDQSGVVMWVGEAISDHCILYDAECITDLDNPAVSALGGYITFKTA